MKSMILMLESATGEIQSLNLWRGDPRSRRWFLGTMTPLIFTEMERLAFEVFEPILGRGWDQKIWALVP